MTTFLRVSFDTPPYMSWRLGRLTTVGSARPVQLSGEKTKAGMPGSYSGGSTMLWEFISWFPSAFFSFLFLSIFFSCSLLSMIVDMGTTTCNDLQLAFKKWRIYRDRRFRILTKRDRYPKFDRRQTHRFFGGPL